MKESSYQQPVKDEVRNRLLRTAVDALTTERSTSPIIRVDELREIVDFAKSVLRPPAVPLGFGETLLAELELWEPFHGARVEAKRVEDLRVLYLCGPEPLNDLQVLLSLGVSTHNVWAVTSSAIDMEKAVAEVSRERIPLKIHHGNLIEFFDVFPESFDIVYLDACGPFAGGKPNTLLPLLSVFVQQRLCPLAALITTFCDVPSEKAAAEKYVATMTAYYRFRYRDLPSEAHEAGIDPEICQHESEQLEEFIRQNVALMYSEFITKMLVELSGFWIPCCRALSMKSIYENYVAPSEEARKAYEIATDEASDATSVMEFAQKAGHTILSPSSYPLMSFFKQLKQMGRGAALGSQLGNFKINGQEMGGLLGFASLLDQVFEGHWEFLSEKMKVAVALSWFDGKSHFSCDVPLPNLLVNSLLGIYGRPSFPNPRKSLRISYSAKQNRMYSDLLLLDECRYFFDWWPTIDMCPSRFESIEFQVLARCMIDRINWHNWTTDTHPFRGGAVACMGQVDCAQPYDFSPREEVEGDGSIAV